MRPSSHRGGWGGGCLLAAAGYDISLSASDSKAAHNASPFSVTDNSTNGGLSPVVLGGLFALALVVLVIWFKSRKGGR